MAGHALKNYWTRKVGTPLLNLFRQGLQPEQIARTLVLGVSLSLFPVVGTTTLLCTAAAVKLKLNLPAIQAVNWLFGGPQLALWLPFLRVGEWLLGAPRLAMTTDELRELAGSGVWNFLRTFQGALLHAVVGWAVLTVPLALLAYGLLRRVLVRRAPSAA